MSNAVPGGPFRKADLADLKDMLPLAKLTVPGFVEHLWSRLAEDGETVDDFGRRAQEAFIKEGQTIVAELEGRVAAMLISYPMAEAPNPHVPGMDEMLKPMMTLFSKAAGTWYLHGIAAYPEFAGRGLGSRLIEVAERQGRLQGKPRTSLLVIDTNLAAIRLYERRGYVVTATQPVVKKGWQTPASDWLLMEKRLV